MKMSCISCLMAACLVALSGLPGRTIAQQKSTTKQTSQSPQNELLAKPAAWGELELRLFKNSHDLMVFSLVTSWIPGEDHQGRFRYKLDARPKLVEKYDSALAQYGVMSERIQACSISIVLYDADGFELRRVTPTLSKRVNDESDVVGLYANESVQMDASEYKSLIGKGNDSSSGSWNIAWNCPLN